MRIKIQLNFAIFMLAVVLFSGCGGGGDSDAPAQENLQPQVLVGVFVDGPVENLTYKTATQSGTTNANGQFLYVNGENITFSIGSVVLGSAVAASVMTPMSLISDASGTDDPSVINMVRLLLSIDSNQEAGDGIQIDDASHSAANGLTIDFSLSTAEFSASQSVRTLVQSVRANGQLVDTNVAQDHFNSTLSTTWGTMVWGQGCWQPRCN